MNPSEPILDASPFASPGVVADEKPVVASPRFALLPHAPIVATLAALDFLSPLGVASLSSANESWATIAAAMFLYGAALGQLVLLALWAALGPEPWPWRVPATCLAAVLCVGALLLGVAMTSQRFDASSASYFVSLLPLIFSATQAPFWVVRLLSRLRIARDVAAAEGTVPRQFGIAHLLGATAGVGAVLGSFRLAMSSTNAPQPSDWLTFTLLFVTAACLSGLYGLPGLWIGLGARRPGLAGGAVAAAIALVVAPIAVGLGMRFEMRAMFFTLAIAASFHGGLYSVLVGGLLPFRAYGFVLRRGGGR